MVDPVLNTTRGMRTCLKCLRKFNSQGPSNRICGKCSGTKPSRSKPAKNPMRVKDRGARGGDD